VKHFLVGGALLMFVSSLPGAVANNHSISLVPQPQVQKIAFLRSFGDSLPPIGYVQFCQLHEADCRPGLVFADRIQLTDAKFRAIEDVNREVNIDVQPETHYGKAEWWAYPDDKKATARIMCWRSAAI